jgi:mannose-1-phosphate guanylyltransferase
LQIILLSGGSGKRLWPLSNDTRSKQFLKLLKAPGGGYESMVQRVYRQIRESGITAPITIATSAAQRDSITSQLGNAVESVLEPERRDTFPAIALAAAYLHSEKGIAANETVAVLPVDPYAEPEYFGTILAMEKAIDENAADIALMGVEPTYPSEKYGYVVPKPNAATAPYEVEQFVEKPTEPEARELIAKGARWNGGAFVFKLGYLLDITERRCGTADYAQLHSIYGQLRKTSFDYEIVEQAKSITMLPYEGAWQDLGTWNTLTDAMPEPVVGNAVIGEGAVNTHIINELRIPVIALGLKDVVVAASPDGILVSDKNASARLKPYVDGLGIRPAYEERHRPMYEERRWGNYKVVDYGKYSDGIFSLTKHLYVGAGKHISYQKHSRRDEIWTIVSGTGDLVLDGHVRNVRRGDVAYITAGTLHAIRATADLRMIEVQIGGELKEEDIERFDWDWGANMDLMEAAI